MTLSVRNQLPLIQPMASQTLSNPAETHTTQTALNPASNEPSSTYAGDKKLVESYIAAVQKKILQQDPGLIKVPADSQLGQWLEQYRAQLENPVVKNWMRDQGIQMNAASIVPSTGALTLGEGDNKKTFTLTDNSGWGQIAGPILDAAKIISPTLGQRLRVDMNGDEVVVRPKVVADFYGEQLPASRSQASAQVRQLVQNDHAFQPIPANDPLRPASSRSAEALHTQTLNAARFYQSAPQALAYKQLAVDVANNLPNTRAEAKKWAEALIFNLTGKHVDADTIYLNHFKGGQSAWGGPEATVTGWEHNLEEPYISLRLPDALLKNFNEGDWIPGNLDANAGLYTVGAGESQKGGYGARNQFPLEPSAVMHAAWKTDFQGEMTQKIDNFWNTHTDQYQTAIKGEFAYRARKQIKTAQAMQPAERALQAPEHRFTREDYRLVMGAVPNLPLDENAPLKIEQLKAQAPQEGQIHALNIAGFASTDILRFSAADGGRQVLYIPGAEPAFLRFDSLENLEQWVIDQTKDDKKRESLASHFPLIVRQDHEPGTLQTVAKVLIPLLWFTGVGSRKEGLDTALQQLASGKLHPALHENQSPITGDVFSDIATATKHRMTGDADVVIKSNSEVTRDTWLNDVTVAAGLLAKLAPVAAPVAAAAVVAGLTELVLGAEKQASGDTLAERQDGASKAFDGLLNTLFSVGASATPEDPFALPSEKQLPPVEPRPQPEATAGEEPQPGTSAVTHTVEPAVRQPLPRSPSLIPMVQLSVPEGEALIRNALRDASGVYRMTDANGVFHQFVRVTDETGKSGIFEISGRYRSGDSFARIINPDTGAGMMVVTPGRDGEWARAPGDGGIRWWRRPVSPTSSDELKTAPRFSDGYVNLEGKKIPGAEIIEDYLQTENTLDYTLFVSNIEENGVVKPKIGTSWTLNEDNFQIEPGEKAGPTKFSESHYSESFIKDIHRFPYTIVTKEAGVETRTALKSTANTEEGLKQERLQQFEALIPDPALRARISEVAHQGSLAPATAYMNGMSTGLQDGYYLSGGDTQITLEYDASAKQAKVHFDSKNPISNPDQDLQRVPGVDVNTRRTFIINESNEIEDSDEIYVIDKHAPTTIGMTVVLPK